MQHFRTFLAIPLSLVIGTAIHAQNTLKDGTTTVWDKEITVGVDSLAKDSVQVSAWTVPVYEAKASEVWNLLKKEYPVATFKKHGKVMMAQGVTVTEVSSSPVDIIAQVNEDKKRRVSVLSIAFLSAGTPTPVEREKAQSAVRGLGVKLNKAVVQQQLDTWTKMLGKADSKTTSAVKSRDKAQSELDKAQSDLEKATREKSKLQSEHVIMQREIDLYNDKWTLSQDTKDFKKLTKARSKIVKNESKMAKLMETEAKAQKDLSKTSSNLPDAQKAKDDKTAAQDEVQRNVDALQRKLENIR